MNAVDVLGLMVPATYLFFLTTERIWPERRFPVRERWQWTGAAFLLLMMGIGTVLPLVLPVDWLNAHRLIEGNKLGIAGGAVLGFVLFEGVLYAWHRSAHTFGFLWRGFHQIHHSPNRVDMPGSTLFHPMEMVVLVLLQLFVTVLVLGLAPLAAAIVGYIIGFNGFFQHWNVRTPRWIGCFIQRPEAHCEHHRMGVHYYNFSDFPPWDMLFGTLRNPPNFVGECGFAAGADSRLRAMLRFEDVNAAQYSRNSRGREPERER